MKSRIFGPAATDFLLKFFSPILEDGDANVMTLSNQLAVKQITNLQNTTTLLQNSAKTFIKGPISKTWDQESIRKISNWVEADASSQSPFWK